MKKKKYGPLTASEKKAIDNLQKALNDISSAFEMETDDEEQTLKLWKRLRHGESILVADLVSPANMIGF